MSVKILIVEDEIIVAKNIALRLKKMGYALTEIATSAEQAIKLAKTYRPDLILMDIRLDSNMDGIDTAGIIRNQQNIPIVYLTAYSDEETLKRAKITEPYGYIIKPFEERELKSNIEIALYKNKMETKIKNNNKHLENIINSASEIIISLDRNFKVTTWNKAAEILTGYKKKEVINKKIEELDAFIAPKDFIKDIQRIINGSKIRLNEIILKDKSGETKIIKTSYSSIYDEFDKYDGILFVGKDITYDQLWKKELLPGNSYLLDNIKKDTLIDILLSFTKIGYKGLYITRQNLSLLKDLKHNKNICIKILQNINSNGFNNISDFKSLQRLIKEFTIKNKKSVILIDRIDYLITRFSFKDFSNVLYDINDIIINNESIFLLHIDPDFFDKRQLNMIMKEIQIYPLKNKAETEIDDELFNILKFIHDENQKNLLVTYKKIRNQFSIAYSTTSIKLNILEEKNLVFIRKFGRYKTVHVTKIGQNILNK